MSTKPAEISFIGWKPAVTASEVFHKTVGFSFLSADEKDRLFWVEQRPDEEGRSVIVMQDTDGSLRDITPTPFSARSRVFEYGGFPYTVSRDWVYFVNLNDQRIYKVNIADPETAIPITPKTNADGSIGKYVDLTVSPNGQWLAFAYEAEATGKEAKNWLGLIDLTLTKPAEPQVLAAGADFYKTPKFSPSGDKIAWLEWNHPYMPWDSTRLLWSHFKDGKLTDKSHLIAGSDTSSISSLCYAENDELIYTLDQAGKDEQSAENYSNVYGFKEGKIRSITQSLREFHQLRCHKNSVFSYAIKNGIPALAKIELTSGHVSYQTYGYVDFSAAIPVGNEIFFVGASATKPSEIVRASEQRTTVIKKATQESLNPDDISVAEPIVFPTSDGKHAYGFFYAPKNAKYRAPLGEKPPVRVIVHGGPIASTGAGFAKQNMFWTSQGYAIFDVNHRGSTGFGRKYRDALKKQWGLLEIQDIYDGIEYLRKRGSISDQAVVSGGSAGGYTVQRLLTFYPNLFSAGASYYGIGNLVTLQKLTHKFESHFLEQLIGGTLETNAREYEERSPVHHMEKLKSPMIIFQGSDDKVVPPENSREIAEILKRKGIRSEYYEYRGEDHGFRKSENLIDSLEKESQFLKSVLNGAVQK